MKSERISLLLLIIIALLPYLNIFQNEFVGYDDQNLIQNNRQIRSLAPENVARMFVPKLRGNYQPIRTLSYAVDYALWGPRPFGFHLTNILLHVFTVAGVWLVFRRLLKEPAPFLAAVFFAVHPIHVESITWMSSRKDVLSLSFSLLAILLYDSSEQNNRRYLYIASIAAAAFAVLSKLTAVSFPLCILLLQVCRDGWPKRAEWVRKLIRLSPHFLVIAVIIGMNFIRFGGGAPLHGDALVGTETASLTVLRDVWLSMPLVFWRYVGLLFFPLHLSTHYAASRITSIAAPQFHIPLLLLLGSAASPLFLFFRGKRIAAFCIAWFFITFLPTSNIIPTAALMGDRYMHIPSIGIAGLLGILMAYPVHAALHERNASLMRTAIIASVAVILFHGMLTIRRNTDWRDTYSLFSRTLAVNPQSVDARLALGAVLEKDGLFDPAIEMYRDALDISPENYRVLYNLGGVYMKKGWVSHAARALENSKAANPKFNAARFNLAIAYQQLGRVEDAIAEHKALLELNPHLALSHGALGRLYLQEGNHDLAMQHLNLALREQPKLVPALIDRAELLLLQGHHDLAERDLQTLSSLGVDVKAERSRSPALRPLR
jgi:tetratricopeptide (TPR) repeat protein